jgi:hypothetical protein
VGHIVECPRCSSALDQRDDGYHCARDGPVPPLWKPAEVGYEAFAEAVKQVDPVPLYLPWPLSPGWTVADFGLVRDVGAALAAFSTTIGTSDVDGTVELTLVAEDPGVGLGARVAGVLGVDPGQQAGQGPPAMQLRAAGRSVPMWHVAVEDSELFAKAVFAGEAEGRWLWLVIRPASAALLLPEGWLLQDMTELGPEALDLPFGGPRPRW